LINERFGRAFRSSVMSALRRPAAVETNPFRTLKYSEFIRELEAPIGINVLRMNPLRGSMLVLMTSELVASIVDNFFGGRGRVQKITGRDFTGAEMRLVQLFRDAAIKDLTESWATVMPVKIEFVQAETNPHFANIMNPNEVLLVSDFDVEILGGKSRLITAVPYSMIEPIRGTLEKSFRDEAAETDRRLSRSLREEMQDAEVTINALVGRSQIPLSRLIDLKAGDVIPCDFNGSAMVFAEDVPVFRGRFGASRGQLSVKVEQRFSPEAPNVNAGLAS
jgi:flagellar motor switch protein FliM